MQKFYRQSSPMTVHVSLTKLSHQALFRSFNLFKASNSSVRHRKKLQSVKVLFSTYRARVNWSHVIRHETEVQEVERRDKIVLDNRLIHVYSR